MAQYTWPPVSISGTSNPSVGVNGDTSPTSSTLVGGQNPGGDLQPLQTDASGFLKIASQGTAPVSGTMTVVQPTGTNLHAVIDSSALPTGASTSANQDTANTSLSAIQTSTGSIDTKTPALGQATMASSTPVVIASNQTAVPISGTVAVSGTSPISGTVAVSNFPATQQVSGTGNFTVVQATGTNLHTVVDSGTITLSGTSPISGTVALSGTSPVSGTVSTKAATPTAGTITQGTVSVGTSAVRLTVAGTAPNANRSLLVVTIDPASTATFYIGSSGVTNSSSTRGPTLVAGQTFIANNDAGDYYIIASATSQTVFVMEQA